MYLCLWKGKVMSLSVLRLLWQTPSSSIFAPRPSCCSRVQFSLLLCCLRRHPRKQLRRFYRQKR